MHNYENNDKNLVYKVTCPEALLPLCSSEIYFACIIFALGGDFYTELSSLLSEMNYREEQGLDELFEGVFFGDLSPHVNIITSVPSRSYFYITGLTVALYFLYYHISVPSRSYFYIAGLTVAL